MEGEEEGIQGRSVVQEGVVFPQFPPKTLETPAEGFESGVGDAGVPGERATDFKPVEGFGDGPVQLRGLVVDLDRKGKATEISRLSEEENIV